MTQRTFQEVPFYTHLRGQRKYYQELLIPFQSIKEYENIENLGIMGKSLTP